MNNGSLINCAKGSFFKTSDLFMLAWKQINKETKKAKAKQTNKNNRHITRKQFLFDFGQSTRTH